MTLPTGARLGPYEILAPLGAGGMGEVYRARDTRLGREVAVKVLPAEFSSDPERLRRFEGEARAAAALEHPNILAVHDVGQHAGSPFVVSELLEGEDLRRRLEGGPLPLRKAVDCAAQIARGLAAAHGKGIVHRDLKPENVFVTRDGRVKILDFGLAKLTRPEEGAGGSFAPTLPAAETGPGVVLGTVGYMSPEQVRGQPADHRSDIFALGAILYEMLTGQRAFQRDSSVETMSAILKEDPPELSATGREAPPGLERILRHCLEKHPEERFQSARDLAFDLEAVSLQTGSEIAPAAAGRRLRGRRVSLAASLLLAAGGILLGALAAGLWRAGRPAAPHPTFQPLTFRRGLVWTARFAPDGQTIVYGASWDGRPVELFSTRPESPESRALELGAADLLAISATGEMALSLGRRFTAGWETSGTLARVPLAGGAPRELLEGVHEADWGPDGETLAVVREVEGRHRLEYPPGRVLYETDGWIGLARVSPDGERIAFVDHPVRGDNVGSLMLVDLEGRRRMLSRAGAVGLAWSPSGREVWASRGNAITAVDLSGGERLLYRGTGTLWLQDVSPQGTALVAQVNHRREMVGRGPGGEEERSLSWLDWSFPRDLSPDGRTVLFEEQNIASEDGYLLYTRGTDGSPAVRIGRGLGLALAPDGRWVLALQRPFSEPRPVLLPTGAGETRVLEPDPLRYQAWAAWLPGGRRLLMAGSRPGEPAGLYLRDLEGGELRSVTPEGMPVASEGLTVSPDGRLATAVAPDGEVYLYPVEGGEPRRLPGLEPGEVPVRWSGEGRSLFVYRPGEVPARLHRLDLASGHREPWLELAPADPAGIFSIWPVHVTPDGSAYVYSYRRLLSDLYLVEGLG